jgi:hypothetical protein
MGWPGVFRYNGNLFDFYACFFIVFVVFGLLKWFLGLFFNTVER